MKIAPWNGCHQLSQCFHISGPPVYETATLRPVRLRSHEPEPESNLVRCMSDASLVKRRRGKGKSAAQREKEKQHRFSINGHYYNYKVGSCLSSHEGITALGSVKMLRKIIM